jgi:pyruvate,water dikinase
MIRDAFERVVDSTFIGGELYFHPTSLNVESVARELPDHVRIITTGQLFDGIEFQALNVAESIGRLRFLRASELETAYVGFEDIVVLDNVPNDISVTRGIITSEFQTPLSHINVLSQNRGTPNMALRNAVTDPGLLEYEGQWVRLRVGLTDYEVTPVDQAEADAWWEENRPDAVQVPGADLGTTDLRNVGEIVSADVAPEEFLAAIKEGTRAFGGKAANYAALAHVPELRVPPAFAVPIYYFRQFMQENGFDERVRVWVDDPALPFWSDPALRDAELERLRDDMRAAPVNPDFERLLMDKLATDYPGVRMRFRSSTNAEDLDGFTGAGLYTSRSGDPGDPTSPVLDAVRRVWSSVWSFRAFEERRYRSIDHQAVGMALLVHRSFPEEEANGVALTNNPFDRAGLEPAFYVNVQVDEFSVVQPEPGATTEEFLHYFDLQGQPVSYLSQSNKVAAGERVLSPEQVQELGVALDRIRTYFRPAYAPEFGAQNQWWAMDVEFKFDAEAEEAPVLFVKQARPFGKR